MVQHSNGNRQRVVACIDNRTGFEVLKYLADHTETHVVCVITHPAATALHHDQIDAFCKERGLERLNILDARADFQRLSVMRPDILLAVYFDYILDDRFLALPALGAINLHPGYLPYNRGFYYYVWAVLDGTPAGVSLHEMQRDVDTGAIISQIRVAIEPHDTADVIYRRHEDAAIDLFKATWPAILSRQYRSYHQLHAGTRHKVSEFRKLEMIDPFAPTTAKDLIDRIRLLTDGATARCGIRLGGKTYRLSLTIEEDTAASHAPISSHPGGPSL